MSEKRDYRDTVFLPKTDFPMKAGLPAKEPKIAARWEEEGLYQQLREARAGRETFVLHDGPPYANGDMHIGHALNHTLKDMVCRTQNLMGKDAPYVPGWDCHGLPIEWKVEEQYRKKKLDKKAVPAAEFRAECRAYAQKWVDVQRDQLKRLGIMGDWDNPYLTMQFDSEATIVAELMKFAEVGNLYRGSKPVMWSPVEETALAEAEVEYEDITSTQIDVAFEITESPIPELVGAHAVIWTTTPWTIPVNQALAYGPEIEYELVEACPYFSNPDLTNEQKNAIDARLTERLPWMSGNRRLLVAKELGEAVASRLSRAAAAVDVSDLGLETVKICLDYPGTGPNFYVKGSDLAGTVAHHPMHHLGGFYAKPRPFLPGDFVTTDSGTGLVHMSPDHGEDDFLLCRANGLEPVFAVMADGRYRDDWEWLGAGDLDENGKERRRSVINKPFNSPEGPICNDLRESGALLSASDDYQHSYPHSWRSKAKVIYRCTPQWFVPMDKDLEGGGTLRSRAMSEIERVRFIPEKGRRRIGSMVEGRPDWVLSRQRAWGVPITLFVKNGTGEYLQDPEVNARVIAAVREHGVDAWDEGRKAEFLGDAHNPDDYEMVADILDVWFDSGCTHAFTLESGRWPALKWPADLYLEGSDQHRGWFQSSLLESCATRGRAPYDQVLTHGFTMASDGRKMSKSLGNTIDPLKVMEQYGADIIRLWALSVDSTEDHRIGDEILKGTGDQYRKLRNTFRYLLGALDGFVGDMGDVGEVPELEIYVLALLADLDGKLRHAAENYDFNAYTRLLVDFCNEDLSAFYFDIRKDVLYCDGPDSVKRNAYRTVLDLLFHALVRYAAPVLVFTAEEVWSTRYPEGGSVHLLEWPQVPGVSADGARWAKLRELREDVMEAIEPLRREKVIRSGLEADVTVPADAVPDGFSDADLAELFITASVTRSDSEGVTVKRTGENKCGRCWRLLPSVAEDGDLCDRCEDVVTQLDGAA
ncbi:isoleucine--tRNA ligase [Qipengyuania flava]|uniref:isoleucine--tRNA ligase n=1 Tax=Qipengyuania flava TaxID=192812 RepID=UPI001C58BA7C|nr:isoleucine--tRNA ligase [Qipengyuania flava]MBW3166818.1 isoleucine--tRNA ligase [Qipengyuania flava]MBY5964056.1 isoleucine--tRNA ligase [Qipengyuania flava]MBY6010380.1 isoleucine--tRNA ligase [Qipengyuania flava]MBY6024822.1 isoleucine--tRNA ligase [Qipengyuania flava]